MILKEICVKCQTEMRVEIIGVLVIEMAEFGPYKVWGADLMKCPGCGCEVVTRFSDKPIRQDHWASDFPAWLEDQKKKATRVIYDYERPLPPF